MDLRFLALALGILVLILWMQRRKSVNTSRGTGHALLGLQEFIQPSVEYVFQAENVEQKEEDDPARDLSVSLGLSPIDPDEVRRHLTAAARAGLNWQTVFEEAVRSELKARPYRAPSIPPAWRVAPIEID